MEEKMVYVGINKFKEKKRSTEANIQGNIKKGNIKESFRETQEQKCVD